MHEEEITETCPRKFGFILFGGGLLSHGQAMPPRFEENESFKNLKYSFWAIATPDIISSALSTHI